MPRKDTRPALKSEQSVHECPKHGGEQGKQQYRAGDQCPGGHRFRHQVRHCPGHEQYPGDNGSDGGQVAKEEMEEDTHGAKVPLPCRGRKDNAKAPGAWGLRGLWANCRLPTTARRAPVRQAWGYAGILRRRLALNKNASWLFRLISFKTFCNLPH